MSACMCVRFSVRFVRKLSYYCVFFLFFGAPMDLINVWMKCFAESWHAGLKVHRNVHIFVWTRMHSTPDHVHVSVCGARVVGLCSASITIPRLFIGATFVLRSLQQTMSLVIMSSITYTNTCLFVCMYT